MISGAEHQKKFIQKRHENIETEVVPLLFGFLIGRSISSGQAQQKRDFRCYFNI